MISGRIRCYDIAHIRIGGSLIRHSSESSSAGWDIIVCSTSRVVRSEKCLESKLSISSTRSSSVFSCPSKAYIPSNHGPPRHHQVRYARMQPQTRPRKASKQSIRSPNCITNHSLVTTHESAANKARAQAHSTGRRRRPQDSLARNRNRQRRCVSSVSLPGGF